MYEYINYDHEKFINWMSCVTEMVVQAAGCSQGNPCIPGEWYSTFCYGRGRHRCMPNGPICFQTCSLLEEWECQIVNGNPQWVKTNTQSNISPWLNEADPSQPCTCLIGVNIGSSCDQYRDRIEEAINNLLHYFLVPDPGTGQYCIQDPAIRECIFYKLRNINIVCDNTCADDENGWMTSGDMWTIYLCERVFQWGRCRLEATIFHEIAHCCGADNHVGDDEYDQRGQPGNGTWQARNCECNCFKERVRTGECIIVSDGPNYCPDSKPNENGSAGCQGWSVIW
jgi:hypothetical protein